MNANTFVSRISSKVGKSYVYATIGNILSLTYLNDAKKRYPKVFTEQYYNKALKHVGKQCFDCTGLIKYVLMGMGDSYDSKLFDPKLDKSADMFIDYCKDVKPFNSVAPPPLGSLLWKPGHVGVYVGNFENVQAKGIDYGVIRESWNATKWEKYGLLPEIDYNSSEHWAQPYYDFLNTSGIISGGDNSKIWREFDKPASTLNVSHVLSLMAKCAGFKP